MLQDTAVASVPGMANRSGRDDTGTVKIQSSNRLAVAEASRWVNFGTPANWIGKRQIAKNVPSMQTFSARHTLFTGLRVVLPPQV